jgi:hypothetical protein
MLLLLLLLLLLLMICRCHVQYHYHLLLASLIIPLRLYSSLPPKKNPPPRAKIILQTKTVPTQSLWLHLQPKSPRSKNYFRAKIRFVVAIDFLVLLSCNGGFGGCIMFKILQRYIYVSALYLMLPRTCCQSIIQRCAVANHFWMTMPMVVMAMAKVMVMICSR